MATVAGFSVTTPKIYANATERSRPQAVRFAQLNSPWKRSSTAARRMSVAAAAPDKLTGKVEESIKAAQETCSDDPVSGECAAAWDEVEELSAAVSHAKDKIKEEDVLETYCKDNPETDECRTYDN